MSLALLAAMLLVLAVVLDLVLASRLEGQLRDRLLDRAGVATILVDRVETRELAQQLEGEGIAVRVTTTDGTTYAAGRLPRDPQQTSTTTTDAPAPPGPADGPAGPAGGPGPKDADIVDAGAFLTVSETLSDGTQVQLYADRGQIDDTLGQVRFAMVVSALVVLLATALALWPVVGAALAPLRRITGVARAITAGDRGRRLRPDRPGTELGRTAAAFDDMLDGLEGAEGRALASEARLRDFVSDAAHELRTPVTGMRSTSEHLLRADPPREERERLLISLVREADRAGRLVEDLLLMARIDRGLELSRAPVHTAELVAECVTPREVARPELTILVRGEDAVVDGDRHQLAQVLANLVDNADQATGGRGRVVLTTTLELGSVVIEVEDDGPGVPEADRERIFERLTRLDDARERRSGGVGLGLAIARGIARAHGGDLTCHQARRGSGARFRLVLPAGG
ncbi:HAMP domain-containing protein [Nocardioides sp. YIM 123512]|uniref:histidine kinase n=2 Tax=Nocardioides flavescens TaxID=2691959 RepID=A0A6L7EXU0_9ACTN|nr:HAMP domain-containing protein [Nocardioides flavescens]